MHAFSDPAPRGYGFMCRSLQQCCLAFLSRFVRSYTAPSTAPCKELPLVDLHMLCFGSEPSGYFDGQIYLFSDIAAACAVLEAHSAWEHRFDAEHNYLAMGLDATSELELELDLCQLSWNWANLHGRNDHLQTASSTTPSLSISSYRNSNKKIV